MVGYAMPDCLRAPFVDTIAVDVSTPPGPRVLANQPLLFDGGPNVAGAALFKHESQHGMYVVLVRSSLQADFDATLEIFEYFVRVVDDLLLKSGCLG